MISSASSSQEDFLGSNDTGIAITTYFSSTRVKASRVSDFVLIPTTLNLIAHHSPKPFLTLDFDSEHMVRFGKGTIDMLRNLSKKVYPLPLLTGVEYVHDITRSSSIKELGDGYEFIRCVPFIKNEKQFTPTFNVVGHGTPNGIGPLDPSEQISPEAFALKMDTLFDENKLSHLKTSPLRFVFHTCNSAYVDVTKEMNVEEIFQSISENSFIGRFNQAMCEKGYTQLSVTGYRGYYTSVTSKHAASARLQDSFFAPLCDYDIRHGEYTLTQEKCTTACSRDRMGFPVQLITSDTIQDMLDAKMSRLSL